MLRSVKAASSARRFLARAARGWATAAKLISQASRNAIEIIVQHQGAFAGCRRALVRRATDADERLSRRRWAADRAGARPQLENRIRWPGQPRGRLHVISAPSATIRQSAS